VLPGPCQCAQLKGGCDQAVGIAGELYVQEAATPRGGGATRSASAVLRRRADDCRELMKGGGSWFLFGIACACQSVLSVASLRTCS
jgi:hypothetical protein